MTEWMLWRSSRRSQDFEGLSSTLKYWLQLEFNESNMNTKTS